MDCWTGVLFARVTDMDARQVCLDCLQQIRSHLEDIAQAALADWSRRCNRGDQAAQRVFVREEFDDRCVSVE